ncbi:hypothetical protein ABVK25_000791 [Lepraria finkii]|uniref:Uncharacterized protein n=1 Tax=Lepraria finkii TaxID=1340010 RepID=A0ABR4BSF1_9LECA
MVSSLRSRCVLLPLTRGLLTLTLFTLHLSYGALSPLAPSPSPSPSPPPPPPPPPPDDKPQLKPHPLYKPKEDKPKPPPLPDFSFSTNPPPTAPQPPPPPRAGTSLQSRMFRRRQDYILDLRDIGRCYNKWWYRT